MKSFSVSMFGGSVVVVISGDVGVNGCNVHCIERAFAFFAFPFYGTPVTTCVSFVFHLCVSLCECN